MPEYYILSQRKMRSDPAMGCLVEFEDVLLDCCDGRLVTPILHKPNPLTDNRYLKWLSQPIQVEIPKRRTSDTQVLILTGMDIGICNALTAIPEWRSRFDVVCAYIFDAFISHSKGSRFAKLVGSMDHIFIPMSGNLQQYKQIFGISATMIPMACDVLKFGSDNLDRHIDLIGYGRQNGDHSRIFAKAFNHPKSQRMYYHTDHMHIGKLHDFYEHRAFFWKILKQSRIALAYDVVATSPERFPFSIVTQRWFECLTAGCLIIGQRPQCPEVDQLLFWEDATIDVPDDIAELLPFTENLLNDKERLETAYRRNYAHALAHHDWRYRIADMLNQLDLPYPESLQRALEDLQLVNRQSHLEVV
jgi:Glycosyl transferases group 1